VFLELLVDLEVHSYQILLGTPRISLYLVTSYDVFYTHFTNVNLFQLSLSPHGYSKIWRIKLYKTIQIDADAVKHRMPVINFRQ
jgi:hypothetical protein